MNQRVLKVLNNVDKVIANSNYTKNLAIEIGVNEEKIIVINPGIDQIKDLDKKSLEKVESLLFHAQYPSSLKLELSSLFL